MIFLFPRVLLCREVYEHAFLSFKVREISNSLFLSGCESFLRGRTLPRPDSRDPVLRDRSLPLLPFVILGAVIMDTDIFFSLLSDTIPSLYLFTHGGIAHNFAGALVLSVLGYLALVLIALAGIIPLPAAEYGMYGFAAVLCGALFHLAIDVLACPGIPLLAPFADRKYTLGVLPGPSILLAGAAFGLVVVTITGLLAFPLALTFYAWAVLLYLTVRVGSFLVAFLRLREGRYRELTRSGGWQSPMMR